MEVQEQNDLQIKLKCLRFRSALSLQWSTLENTVVDEKTVKMFALLYYH